MNKVHTAAHMEGMQLWTDLGEANEEIKRLSAEGVLKDKAIVMAREKIQYAEIVLTVEEWDLLEPVKKEPLRWLRG